jgi:endonuclease/exonuclease/phosphatase family metal-dependent hydrolase
MLVRAWNLHLGKTAQGRGAHLREMIELVTAGGPTFVCLQELPVWALDELGGWTGMKAVAVRATRPKLGPVVVPAGAGRLGSPGKGNAILLPTDAQIREEKQVTLNTNPFCEEQAATLGYSQKEARWWERERRVCHLVKLEFPDRSRFLVANLHATSLDRDRRLANAELRRAMSFVDRQAEVEETVIVGGDFNVPLGESPVLTELTKRLDERYAAVSQGAEQILVRGRVAMSGLRIWPDADRTRDGRLLSDHAPVEVAVTSTRRAAEPAAQAESEQPRLPTLEEAQRAAPLTPAEPSRPGHAEQPEQAPAAPDAGEG